MNTFISSHTSDAMVISDTDSNESSPQYIPGIFLSSWLLILLLIFIITH